MHARPSNVMPWILGFVLSACGQVTEDAGNAYTAGDSSCVSQLTPLTQRSGDLALMTLSYDCGGVTCRGDEAFAEGATFAVRLEMPLDVTPRFTLAGDDDDVLRARVTTVEHDDCAQQTRVLASVTTGKAGTVQLMLLRDDEPFDSIELRVERASTLDLRASTLEAFDFSKSGGTVTTLAGTPVVVVPRVLDAAGGLLLGAPALTWRSRDPSVAVVRTKAESNAEELVALATAGGVVFVDTLAAGLVTIEARSEYGVSASIEVLVEEAPSAYASSRMAAQYRENAALEPTR